jgi:benzoyl-CoA reductase/2-hydroxyglutaryl-CoA dehydratase subunit BcrC/BadD/HgdB
MAGSPAADVESVRLQAEALARAAAAQGRKVVGYVTPSAPVELIEAAGLYPIELSAGGVGETPLADEIMEDLFHPPIRALFERVLRGEFAWLSAIVCPRTGDAAHRLYYYLCELERTGVAVPKPLLFDVTQTPGAASEAYSAAKIDGLWRELQALGSPAGDAQLNAAIAASNARRVMLGALVEKRREGRVAGAGMLAAMAASRMLPWDAFAKFAAAAESAHRAGPRLAIAGSAHDDTGLHGLVEATGGVVVGDFHSGGEMAIGAAIGGGEPMVALLTHYRSTLAGARSFEDMAKLVVAFAKATRADGVVFSYLPEEEALPWDYPEQARALDAAGIAHVRLGDQARPYDVEARRGEVEAVVRSLGAKR